MELFQVYGTIGLKDAGFKAGIADATKGASGLTSGIHNLISTVAGIKVVSGAFDLVRNSIGAAVERVDTLNRFPLVMEQMGFGADNARAAMDRLSEGIQGLPTALNEIVGSTQRMAIITGDIDLATESALALNNALFASGATAITASQGTEQYMQALSKGKPDMMEWRTLLNAMPLALQRVADSFGFTGQSAVTDFGEALRGGQITMTEFNARLIELNAGVGGFAELAKTSTAGIGTAWTNMQTAVVRGTAAIVTSIDQGLSQTRFGSIQNVIQGFGKGFESVLKTMAKVIQPVVANLDKLAPAVIAVTTAFAARRGIDAFTTALQTARRTVESAAGAQEILTIAMKNGTAAEALAKAATDSSIASERIRIAMKQTGITVNEEGIAVTVAGTAVTEAEATVVLQSAAAVSTKTAMLGAHSIASGIATGATQLFSAALNALPFVAVIGGITLLVSWLMNMGDEASAAKIAVDEINSTFEAGRGKAEANAIAASRLVDELANLESQGNLTTVQQARYAQIVKQLNELMPDLNIEIDEQTGRTKQSTEALRDNVEALKDQYIQQAYIKKSSDLYEKQAEVIVKLNDAQLALSNFQEQKMNPAMEALAEATGKTVEELTALGVTSGYTGDEIALLIGGTEDFRMNVSNLGNDIYWLGIEQRNLTGEIADGEKAIADFQTQIDANSESLGYYESKLEPATSATENFADTTESSILTISDAYDTLSDVQKTAIDSILGTYETMTSSLSDLSEKIKLDSKTTWAAIVENQNDTIAKTQEFTELYATLINAGVSESYLEAIGATGPKSIPLLQSMLKAGTDEVLASQAEWENAYGVIADTAIDAFGMDSDTAAAIKEYVLGETGIFGTLQTALNEADFESLGLGLSESTAAGITEGASIATEAMAITANDIIEAWRSKMVQNSPSQVFIELGAGLPQSIAMGIQDTSNTPITSMQLLSDNIIIIASEIPSKMTPIGKDIVLGAQEGMESMRETFYVYVYNFFSNIVSQAKSALGIASPSKVMASMGVFSVQGYIQGLESQRQAIETAITDIFTPKFEQMEYIVSIDDADMGNTNQRSGTIQGQGNINIVQNIQAVPQTPYEMAQQTAAAFKRARWALA